MKNTLLYILAIFVIISCGEKTAEDSKYASQIKELDTFLEDVGYNYLDFNELNIDDLNKIKEESEKKYKQVKGVYKGEEIDTTYEVIMLTYKGQMIKGLRGIGGRHSGIKKEFEEVKKQIHNLKDNLIHETFSAEDSEKYILQEKNALEELNFNMKSFTDYISNVYSIKDNINLKMDSIITANE